MSPTGRQLLHAATDRLQHAGVVDAQGDAVALMAHAIGGSVPRHDLIAELARQISPEAEGLFHAAVAARERRQPVAQIIGARQFWNHRFHVTPDVLDPRPDTETLVAAALTHTFSRVLDLGTGSGCILVSLLAERRDATGIGTDLSVAALAVAQRNAKEVGSGDRASFLISDWFAGVNGRFDLIVSNPPYIAEDEMAGLAPEVRDHEPRMALTPGGDGLDAYRVIAAGVAAHLSPGGRILLEVGPTQGQVVKDLLAGAGLVDLGILPDLDGRNRVVAGRAPSK